MLQGCMQSEDVKEMFKELERRVGGIQINEVRNEIRQLYEKGGGTFEYSLQSRGRDYILYHSHTSRSDRLSAGRYKLSTITTVSSKRWNIRRRQFERLCSSTIYGKVFRPPQ